MKLSEVVVTKRWWGVKVLTEKIKHLPGEQAYKLLLQHLLRHLTVLVHHHLLILTTKNREMIDMSPPRQVHIFKL